MCGKKRGMQRKDMGFLWRKNKIKINKRLFWIGKRYTSSCLEIFKETRIKNREIQPENSYRWSMSSKFSSCTTKSMEKTMRNH